MTYEMRAQSGTLFKNNKKTKDNQPDYQGDALIDGKTWRISAWIKSGQKGKFMSLSFQPPYDKGKGGEKRPEDDYVPF